MNRLVVALPVCLSMLGAPVFAANNASEMDGRLCNLQAREIALRISEELGSDYTANERGEIARIAEEVCQNYGGQGSSLPMVNRPVTEQTGQQGMPASARQASQQASPQRVMPVDSDAMADNESETAAEEESEGILGGLKIIDAQDRVRRPGLKRR